MSDFDSIRADAEQEEELILQADEQIEYFDTELAKRLRRDAKINKQPPSVQKYWLGRLTYELAIRNNDIKDILKESEKLSTSIDHYSNQQLSEQKKFLILKLHSYGFTAQPKENVLATQHTTFPTRLIHYKYGYIDINSIKKIEKLLAVLDGKTAKELNMNTNNHKIWFKIGKAYIQSYMELLSLDCDNETNKQDYEPIIEPISSPDSWSL